MTVRRAARVSLLLAIGIAVLACVPPTREPPSPSPLAAACPAELPNVLVDEDHDYRLCLPPSWRDLGVNDPIWTEAFGPNSQLEREFLGGRLDHVAIPLDKLGDAFETDLVVDSPPRLATETFEEARDALVSGLVELGAIELASATVDVAGGGAARVVLDISEMPGLQRDGRLLLFFVPTEGATITLRFTCAAETCDGYEPTFDAMLATMRFEAAEEG